MFFVQLYKYFEDEDEFKPMGTKVPCLTLDKAKELAIQSHTETGEYYCITKFNDEKFRLWHDEI